MIAEQIPPFWYVFAVFAAVILASALSDLLTNSSMGWSP